MARRKIMTLAEIRKHRKNITESLHALTFELEVLADEVNPDEAHNTDEIAWIEDNVYGCETGIDDKLYELMEQLMTNRKYVKDVRSGGGGGSL
jgi:hypothetical protein